MATSQRFRMTRTTSALAGTAVLAAALVTVSSAAARVGRQARQRIHAPGTGQVFKVNPVQSSGNQALTDMKDSDAAVPLSEYASVPLRNLDGSGYLRGKWATIQSSTGHARVQHDQHVQLHAPRRPVRAGHGLLLGEPGAGVPAVPGLRVDAAGASSRSRSPSRSTSTAGTTRTSDDKPDLRIRLGKGGVDDAEDAEVIVHEYGHAVHASQVAGFGASLDAGSIGESFGDYLAVTVGLAAAEQYDWPVERRRRPASPTGTPRRTPARCRTACAVWTRT